MIMILLLLFVLLIRFCNSINTMHDKINISMLNVNNKNAIKGKRERERETKNFISKGWKIDGKHKK